MKRTSAYNVNICSGPGSVSESSSAHNFTAGVQIPPSQPAGDYVLSLAMPFLVGVSAGFRMQH
jgi:hypothetical protein